MIHTLNIDVETFSTEDIKAGVHRYTTASDLLLFGYSFDRQPVQVVDIAQGEEIPDSILNAMFDKNVAKKAWNAAFEIEQMERFLMADLDLRQWFCTMVKSARCGYPLSLDMASKAIGLPVEKDSAGKALIKLFSVPRKPTKTNPATRIFPWDNPEKWEEYKRYNKQDVVVEMHIDEFLSQYPDQPAFEQKMYVLDRQINKRGLELDIPFIDKAIEIDRQYKDVLTEEAKQITGLANPNSVLQLKTWFGERGLEVDSLNKESLKEYLLMAKQGFTDRAVSGADENILQFESTEIHESDKVLKMLELRKELSNTSVKKYIAMKASQIDGRIYDTIQFNGAGRTGRNAGRLIQPQNLPRVYMNDEELDIARRMVKYNDLATLEMCFESVSSVLSQLIRTAIVSAEGKILKVSDLSAIEARVLAWLAGEEHVLEVFRTHGKIYEATAAMMFKVPFESITKGSIMRQRGKVASLACGYQGGANAITTMDLDKSIPDDEKPGLVKAWRDAHPNIVQFWYKTQKAAIRAIQYPGEKVPLSKGAYFIMHKDALLFYLPSGRYLMYPKATLEEGSFGPSIRFWGMEQTTNKWLKMSTYSGKLVENCLAGNTRVVTNNGIKTIISVLPTDTLWDGISWVAHQGLAQKGIKKVIDLNGVLLTEDHKILTTHGWKNASSCSGLERYENRNVVRSKFCWFGWYKILVDFQMRLRQRSKVYCFGILQGRKEIMRMPKLQTRSEVSQNTQHVKTSCVLGLEINEGSLSVTNSPSLAQLWRSGHFSMRSLGRSIRKFLGGYGADLQERSYVGENRCERELRTKQLYLGIDEKASEKQTCKSTHGNALGLDNGSRSFGKIWNKLYNLALSFRQKRAARLLVRETGRYEQVYDLINSGPLHRFTVLDENDKPLIVHNCVQAVARDVLMYGMYNMVRAGYDLVTNVHDETVAETPIGFGSIEEVEKLMCDMPAWADGLPLGAEGFESEYYKK